MIKIYWLLFLGLVLQIYILKVESLPIHIENQKDYGVLTEFFKMGISDEEYGYVLENVKPISIRDFYSLDCFPGMKDLNLAEKEFFKTLLVREAIDVWNQICSHQKNFVLKAIPLKDPESVETGWEVQFINVLKLTEVIDKNIDLFRYILGPSIETDQLVNEIAYSKKRFTDILHNDLVLVGIVLGFGSHNSLSGGRVETINALTISEDHAPFTSKSFLIQSKKNHSLSFLTPQRYGGYYLEFAGGDDSFFRNNTPPLQPSFGFSNVADELVLLDAMREPLPASLNEKPGFVFSAFRGGFSNKQLFESLTKAQKHIQALLKKPDFLEQVLEKIGGEKPIIACNKFTVRSTLFSRFHSHLNIQEWIHILKRVANHFEDKKEQLAFIEAFSHPSPSFRIPPKMVGVSKATLEGLKKALHNFTSANAHFDALSQDSSFQSMISKLLYSKIITLGAGKKLKGADRVRIGYVIEDPEGSILFANHDTWLNLSQTIPGFAHGVEGMHVGEKRLLFIHPALAYGVLTTLPPCIELIVKVHLLDIDETSCAKLPSLTLHDFNWIQNASFYQAIEESVQQFPFFTGSFYRDMLDKIETVDKAAISAELEAISRSSLDISE